MKKIKKIGLCAVVVALCVGLCGCGLNVKTDVVNNLSDIRYNIFVGQAEGITANLMCGMRENPYNYDGISNKKTEFGVITVNLKSRPESAVHYQLTVGDDTFSGTLEENPYNHTFMTDIEKIVLEDDGIYLTVENVVQNMQLVPESVSWKVQYSEALDIGILALEEDIMALYKSRRFCGECYLKIISDISAIENPYYWCFIVVSQDGKTKSVVIDVNSGDILSQA